MIDFPASPTTGQIFTAAGSSWRYDGTKWVAYGSGSGNAGRNYVMNSQFNIAQRGPGAFITSGYTTDRWYAVIAGDTASFAQLAHSDASRTQIGDEAATSYLSNIFTGSAAVGAVTFVYQPIEDVRRLAGKTVTVSFWASATAAKLGINILQSFGTGGSPSTAVRALATGSSVTLSASMVRYSTTIAIPSIVGKTLGTNNNSYTALELFYTSGSTNNAIAGNIGVQSGTTNIWGVQLEIGSVATPLEKPDPADDLAKCQRFYYASAYNIQGYSAAGVNIVHNLILPVTMRAQPTIVNNVTGSSNVTLGSSVVTLVASSSPATLMVIVNITGTGGFNYIGTYTASADL